MSANRITPVTLILAVTGGMACSPACRRETPEPNPIARQREEVKPVPETPPHDLPITAEPEQVAEQATSGRSSPDRPVAKAATKVRRPSKNPLKLITPRILASWKEIQSVSATVETSHVRKKSPTLDKRGGGTRDCMKKNGRTLLRTRLSYDILLEGPGDPGHYFTGQRLLKVYDGQFLYVMNERHKSKTVTKLWPSGKQIMSIGGGGLLAALSQVTDLEMGPAEKIDEHNVWVLKGTTGKGLAKVRYYIDMELGILRKYIWESEEEETVITFKLKDIKINVEFPEDHFTFTPPDDVEVRDLTKPSAPVMGPPTPP